MESMKLTYVTVFSIFYMISLIIIYFSKDRLDNIENRIYKKMLITNLIGLLLQFMCGYVSSSYLVLPAFLSNVILKLYLVYFVVFAMFLLLYVVSIINFKRKKFITIFTYISSLLTSIIIFILPIYLFYDKINSIAYSYGPSVNFSYIFGVVSTNFIVMLILFNYKKIDKIKVIPLIVYIMLGMFSICIQHNHPEIIIICYIESFVCFLMLHTIENPDVKMLKELEVAKDLADKANNAKSDFLSSMSHEIRTPLNAIVGFSEDIQNHKEGVNEIVYEDTNYIMEASKTLLEIVGNILDFSKIESNRMKLIMEDYNFKKEVDSLCKINEVRIGNKDIRFNADIDSNIPDILYGDRTHIKQIFNNLLSNAFKYTEKGTVDLIIKSEINNDTCKLNIIVKDTGRGISKENLDKLFNKFERLDVEKDSSVEGTGLGLSITKSLIELMGGTINVKSEFGKGTEFDVSISQKIKQHIVNEEKVDDSQVIFKDIFKNKRILIVDDNVLNIKVARRAINDFNFDIDEAHDGLECINKIKEGNKFDVILMDIMMPNMNGDKALEELKKIEGFDTPVIALTADALSESNSKYLKMGFSSYLSKPFTREQIYNCLKDIFNK